MLDDLVHQLLVEGVGWLRAGPCAPVVRGDEPFLACTWVAHAWRVLYNCDALARACTVLACPTEFLLQLRYRCEVRLDDELVEHEGLYVQSLLVPGHRRDPGVVKVGSVAAVRSDSRSICRAHAILTRA